MSSDPHATGHDAHESHTFDAEPIKELAPDEPRTPGWIPVLGIALFTGAAVWALAGGGDPPAEGAKPEEPAAAAHAGEVPAAPATATAKMSPEDAKVLAEKIRGMRAKGELPKLNP